MAAHRAWAGCATITPVGPPDRESWLLQRYLPSGTARGWRRTGCLAMLVVPIVLVAVVLVVVILAAVL